MFDKADAEIRARQIRIVQQGNADASLQVLVMCFDEVDELKSRKANTFIPILLGGIFGFIVGCL